jgi:hypothetical protein
VAPDQRYQLQRLRDHLRGADQVSFVDDKCNLPAKKSEPSKPIKFWTGAGFSIIDGWSVNDAIHSPTYSVPKFMRISDHQIITHFGPGRFTHQIKNCNPIELSLELCRQVGFSAPLRRDDPHDLILNHAPAPFPTVRAEP